MLIEVIAYSFLSKTECGLGRYLTELVNLAGKKWEIKFGSSHSKIPEISGG